MTWYGRAKTAQFQIDNFFDRNVLNERIRSLKKMAVDITYLSSLVFQSANETQKRLQAIMGDKKFSSYPDLIGELKYANNIVYDSPWKFADICYLVADELVKKANKLEKDRKAYIRSLNPETAYKGLRF